MSSRGVLEAELLAKIKDIPMAEFLEMLNKTNRYSEKVPQNEEQKELINEIANNIEKFLKSRYELTKEEIEQFMLITGGENEYSNSN